MLWKEKVPGNQRVKPLPQSIEATPSKQLNYKTLPRSLLYSPIPGLNPLFLKTLVEELRMFGVPELSKRIDYYLESKTVDDLFERVLDRVEGDFGLTVSKVR